MKLQQCNYEKLDILFRNCHDLVNDCKNDSEDIYLILMLQQAEAIIRSIRDGVDNR